MTARGFRLEQSLGQHMLLQPRMLQSIEVLQLPAGELESWLRKAAEENEALEVPDPGPEPALPRRVRSMEATQAHDELLHNQPEREPGLLAELEAELALLDLEPQPRAWVRLLIECIDPAGYLSISDEELLAMAAERGLEGGPAALVHALALLRSLQPRGIGARNAIEALLLQLDASDPDYAHLRLLLCEFLEELARNKLPAVARAMGIPLVELQRLIERLGQLEPRPAAGVGDLAAPPVRADLSVERDEHGFVVRIEGSEHDLVRVAPSVAALCRDRRQPAEVRSYLRGKLDRARWIVAAVEQRAQTLARIAERVFAHQRPFLEHGPGHLLPLRMGALARELKIHVSTVSRAVAGKHAATPFGLYPLRHFFQSAAGSDVDSAREDVREAVRAIFAAEDPARPLSDDEVVERMARRGWKLARRTIAKYRRELGIKSSYQRRVYR